MFSRQVNWRIKKERKLKEKLATILIMTAREISDRTASIDRDAARMANSTRPRTSSRPWAKETSSGETVAPFQEIDQYAASCRGSHRRWHNDDGFSSGRRCRNLSFDYHEHGIRALPRPHHRQFHQHRRGPHYSRRRRRSRGIYVKRLKSLLDQFRDKRATARVRTCLHTPRSSDYSRSIPFLSQQELNITVNADRTLYNFCKWQQKLNPSDDSHPNHHDVAILVTRKDICSRANTPCSTLGVAHVAGMCQPDRSCSVNEDNGITLAHTITHELGHK